MDRLLFLWVLCFLIVILVNGRDDVLFRVVVIDFGVCFILLYLLLSDLV